MERQSEVRPHVNTMPGSEAFVFQTGGSARRRAIKPDGQAPSITFRVTGVPGHTHNSCAVASVLCDLKRERGFAHNLTDAGGDAEVEMRAADIGDSEPVPNEDDRFDHALERGIGEVTLIPENCHQQIREPTRAIAEVRHLVAPRDKFTTMTYVEEVGGFVNPRTKAPYISDFPDVLVDMLGQKSLSSAAQHLGHYTAALLTTPVSIRSTGDWNFVVPQPPAGAVGTLNDGTAWNGIVPFRWIQAENLYRAEAFTVTLNRTVEVGPVAAGAYPNKAESALTVTFPDMETTVASNGYCFFMHTLDATTVLLGANEDSGYEIYPKIPLRNVTKPEVMALTNYEWHGPPAYRILVGGNYALPGPQRLEDCPN